MLVLPRLWTARILPFASISGALIIATLLGDYALHRLGLVWIGRYLGIPGTLLILAALTYSLRKCKHITWGKPTRWITFHEFGAWLGAWLVLLHSGVHFNSVLAWIATAAMCINVLSGLVGKLLLTSSRQLVGERRKGLLAAGMAAEQVEAQIFWDSVAVRVMSQWRKLHIPIFIAFAVLALAHIVSVFVFWGWR